MVAAAATTAAAKTRMTLDPTTATTTRRFHRNVSLVSTNRGAASLWSIIQRLLLTPPPPDLIVADVRSAYAFPAASDVAFLSTTVTIVVVVVAAAWREKCTANATAKSPRPPRRRLCAETRGNRHRHRNHRLDDNPTHFPLSSAAAAGAEWSIHVPQNR